MSVLDGNAVAELARHVDRLVAVVVPAGVIRALRSRSRPM